VAVPSNWLCGFVILVYESTLVAHIHSLDGEVLRFEGCGIEGLSTDASLLSRLNLGRIHDRKLDEHIGNLLQLAYISVLGWLR